MRKLYFKIKRFLFKLITGLNPEDVRKLTYVQKYLEAHNSNNMKRYNDYLEEHFNA